MIPSDDFQKFRASIVKLNSNKDFKITHSYGTKQGWRWLKKNKWLNVGQPITENQFGQIIKGVNKILLDKFLKGSDIKFPHRMGRLELRKYTPHIEVKDGRVITNLPINWKRTLQLWHTDKEAKDNKYLVRLETNEIFKILYNKHNAIFKYKQFFNFTPARGVKNIIRNKANNNELDAFML